MLEVIILAGGFGTRVSAITNGLPKPLLKIAGKPILEHQIRFLQRNGIKNIRLSLHHEAGQIINFCEEHWPGEIKFFVEPEPLGTGGAIKFASRDLVEPFIVLNGDIISDMDVSNFISTGVNAIACVHKKQAQDFGLIRMGEGKIIEFLEKPKEPTSGLINAGWYLLEPRHFRSQSQDKFMVEKEIFPVLASQGELHVYQHTGYWMDVGTPKRYQQMQQDAKFHPAKERFLA